MTTMTEATVTLDVREDIHEGREPFARIMETAAQLKSGQRLRLMAPFKPWPLFSVLARQGFAHEARPMDSGDWEVLFVRSLGAPMTPETTPAISPLPSGNAPVLEVDARGLEPPQPLVVILEALARLPESAALRARTDRRPLHLYAQLEQRGFIGETEEQKDGSFVTSIRRA